MTEINPETLKLYRQLQPLFKGPWQVGDRWRYPATDDIYFVESNFNYSSEPPPKSAFHLPLPIDPVNPERGLWGMLRKDLQYQLNWNIGTILSVYDGKTMINVFDAATVELALLKALKHQHPELGKEEKSDG